MHDMTQLETLLHIWLHFALRSPATMGACWVSW